MNKNTIKWLALGLTIFLSACSKPEPKVISLQGNTMGTYYQIKYVVDAQQQDNKKLSLETLQAEIDTRLELVNDLMSFDVDLPS